jgi:hypothetical protein
MRWPLYLLPFVALAADLPPLPLVSTNVLPPKSYHFTLTFDAPTNADWYAVIVRSNGVETQRRYAMTNFIAVSNLFFPLSQYQFTAIATNSLNGLISDESNPAPLRCMTVMESDGPTGLWVLLKTNNFIPSAPQHFIALSNWLADSVLKPDSK